jgi:hypothetical protein
MHSEKYAGPDAKADFCVNLTLGRDLRKSLELPLSDDRNKGLRNVMIGYKLY